MVMGNAYRENETLIYDHLHRRSKKSEGLENYPENVVECHEQFTQKIMESSHARVEVVYGRQVQARVLHLGLKITAIPLWGSFANIVLYFVHEDNFANKRPGHRFRKVLLFATHPQRMFYEREGGEIAARQGRILEAAVRIADATITFQADYYQAKRWREYVPSVNQLGLYRAVRLYESFPFKYLPEVRQEPQGVEATLKRRHSGRWGEIFSPEPHSNEAIRKMLDEATKATEALDQGQPTKWQDPAQLPPAVLTWLKGQKQVLFYDGPINGASDIAITLDKCKTSLSRSERREIERHFLGQGLRTMLGQLMLGQKSVLSHWIAPI